MAARESSAIALRGYGGRRRSNRPRNLSGIKDRTRLTVWKVPAESGPPKGQSSQALETDGGGSRIALWRIGGRTLCRSAFE
jgi:hypothetical protein